MALIKCPECGTEVSDKAKACPRCAYPIAEIASRGKIRIKLNPIHGRQRVSIFEGEKTIWQGFTGDIAELKIDNPTTVMIRYHYGMNGGIAKGEGVIDPDKSGKYSVVGVEGTITHHLAIQAVDVIDSE